jgi:hypothetical protein
MQLADRYLQWIAKRCREAYIQERTQYELSVNEKLKKQRPPYRYRPAEKWDGGTDDDGREHKSIWISIARFMIANKLSPEITIRKRFAISRGKSVPWPNQIAVATYLDVYTGVQSVVSAADVATCLEMDKTYARAAFNSLASRYAGLDSSKQTTAMLLDNTYETSPLMRYCLAHACKLPDVAKRLARRALAQYTLAADIYDRVWKEIIPDNLRNVERQLSSKFRIDYGKTK